MSGSDEAGPGQYHFDPVTYLDMILAEVPAYRELQRHLAEATTGIDAGSILELGVGTGETASAVLAVHPAARLVGIDESEPMLAVARDRFPGADLRAQRLEDPLPEGSYDLVVSALAVHHVDAAGKADLFRRVRARLRPGGRFVLADVVVPDDPRDAVIPVDPPYDQPSPVADQLSWLREAGFQPAVRWQEKDLVVVAADVGSSGYQVVPIGWVESPLTDRAQAPRQGDEGAPDAWLVFQPGVAEGIRDLAAGTEIIVLTWLDRAARDVLVTRPRDDPALPLTGVFSTRSPDRPNPIGLHRVQVVATEGLRILVRPLEALDKTPIIDVKPVLRGTAER